MSLKYIILNVAIASNSLPFHSNAIDMCIWMHAACCTCDCVCISIKLQCCIGCAVYVIVLYGSRTIFSMCLTSTLACTRTHAGAFHFNFNALYHCTNINLYTYFNDLIDFKLNPLEYSNTIDDTYLIESGFFPRILF